MKKFTLDYSKKNIPIPSKHEYRIQLLSKAEKVIKRMRWKANFFLNECTETLQNTYGFRTRKCPPKIPELAEFENDVMLMCKNIAFKNVNNEFLTKLKEDVKNIKSSNKMLVDADKTRNTYQLEKETYKHHLMNNITATYKKANLHQPEVINNETLAIVKKIGIEDRVEKMSENQAYITIKDHKPDFVNRPTFRLINPSKTDLGKVSKTILDSINMKIKASQNLDQWKNSKEVINWFNDMSNKKMCKFIQFDIESFYPSITHKLLTSAIEYARTIVPISDTDLSIIMQSRKTLLFSETQAWTKKTGDENFDVPMGCFDGAEVCELVGLYLLSKLSGILGENKVGLYRDDGLGILINLSGSCMERLKKKIIKVFKENGLKITIDVGLNSASFLDVTFDLKSDTYKPFMKDNANPVYVHAKSNHPPNIIKQIPGMIGKRLSELSKNEEIFLEACPAYEEALAKCGYKEKLKYTIPENPLENPGKRNRKRNIIWFNPPFSQNVETSVGKLFLKLIDKHFPPGKLVRDNKEMHKLFNRNNVKVSYCCMKNMGAIISSHNKKLLKNDSKRFGCNCRIKENCPLDGKCLTPNITYKAYVSNNIDDEQKWYIGMTKPPFKNRYGNHKSDFKHPNRKNNTELAQYVWQLKENNKVPSVRYEILHQIPPSPVKYGFCRLCVSEKLEILNNYDDEDLLNSRSEFVSKCRHQNSTLISNGRNPNGQKMGVG